MIYLTLEDVIQALETGPTTPGHQETWVDYDQDRAPLLFIGGQRDQIMPFSVNTSNAHRYRKSPAVTEYHEFEGRDHWTCAAPGWETVADHALQWAVDHEMSTRGTVPGH